MIKRSQVGLSGLLKVKDSFTAITAARAHPLELSVKYVQNVSPEVIALWLSVDLIQLFWQSLTVRVLKSEEKPPDPEFSSPSCSEECL